MAQVTDAEAQRIISHMNAQHEQSLGHYLEYYGRIPSSLAYAKPEIVSFTTPSMKLQYGPPYARKDYTHDFSPPMHAGQARKRLEEMHAHCKEQLGISDAVVSGVNLPMHAVAGIFLGLSLTYLLLTVRPERLASWVPWQTRAFAPLIRLAGLDPKAPADAGRVIKACWLGLWYLIHTIEIFLNLEPNITKYNVNSASTKLAWRILTFIGGFPVWQALRNAGREEEKRLKSQ